MDTLRRTNLQGRKIIGIINKHSLAVFIKYANQLCDGLTAVLISVMSFWSYATSVVLVIVVCIN